MPKYNKLDPRRLFTPDGILSAILSGLGALIGAALLFFLLFL